MSPSPKDKEMNAGKTITQVMIENQWMEESRKLKAFLDNPAIKKTNAGYEIDVIELLNQLDEKNKEKIIKYLTWK